jgi:thiamine transporter
MLGMFEASEPPVLSKRVTLRQAVPVKILAEMASAIALSGALSLITIFTLPQGGSITLASMVPVLLFALRRGPKLGVIAGAILGLVVLVEMPFVVHPAQLLLDYPFAFGALGLAGLFRNRPLIGVAIGITGRFIMHFISGVIFFASYAWDGWNPIAYSAAYNAGYLIPEMVISGFLIVIIVRLKALQLYL